jgi:hypothetical protein
MGSGDGRPSHTVEAGDDVAVLQDLDAVTGSGDGKPSHTAEAAVVDVDILDLDAATGSGDEAGGANVRFAKSGSEDSCIAKQIARIEFNLLRTGGPATTVVGSCGPVVDCATVSGGAVCVDGIEGGSSGVVAVEPSEARTKIIEDTFVEAGHLDASLAGFSSGALMRRYGEVVSSRAVKGLGSRSTYKLYVDHGSTSPAYAQFHPEWPKGLHQVPRWVPHDTFGRRTMPKPGSSGVAQDCCPVAEERISYGLFVDCHLISCLDIPSYAWADVRSYGPMLNAVVKDKEEKLLGGKGGAHG